LETFNCKSCHQPVTLSAPGTRHRNHCPFCLHSVHLDIVPGDRAANCGGIMVPIAVWVRSDQEWSLIHRCTACSELRSNRIAGDDSPHVLLSLAAKPLAMPPFPLEYLSQLQNSA